MKYKFVKKVGDTYHAEPEDMYKAAFAEVQEALNGGPIRRDQVALLARFEALPEGSLDPKNGDFTIEAQTLGLLRKWFNVELQRDLGVDGISLDIAKDENWRG